MELTKNFEPRAVEEKWYAHWLSKGYFNSKPDGRPAFTVVIPPPNVTGVLHMGHTLNETVQDILVRKARMSGFNACWVPGSDHASIATEAKVVAMLKEKGIDKNKLSREEFLKYAFEWKDKYGSIIYNQIERLGCSVDWNRTTFTMDDHYYKAVIKVFIDLYNKGLIYRGARMINWDPAAKTALSDEEVEYKELQGKLYYLKYPVVSSKSEVGSQTSDFITIATQRPETIMGDTAICVNPNDERYAHLKGAYAFVPLINRRIPVIFDDYVDPAFGTGALKVTPAHDINDYNLGLKHKLEVVDTINEDGTMSAAAQIYIGEDRFAARKKIIKELAEKGFLTKDEEYTTRLGYSQRTGVVVEPRISTQWFVKMKELATPALKAVVDGDIRIHPGDKFLATYKYWLENVKDWCISRQLWWGQQIPAWYDADGKMVVAETKEEAAEQFKKQNSKSKIEEIQQDADVLDTWFSSWLWPMEVFKGITNPGNEELKYYYPGSVLVTGQDIIFFWVARMVMAGMEYEKQIPFKDVYFTGMVRDKLGRKMSKQLGNSPDLLDLIDRYGADAVRFGIMVSSPAGNDLMFDENSLEQGRNFNNKIWNALKLVKMWEERIQSNDIQNVDSFVAINWFENRLTLAKLEVDDLISQFRLSEALKTIYSLIWDDFCSKYLEWVKLEFNKMTVYRTIIIFEELMMLLHPFMPFITEEVYHKLRIREAGDDICIRQIDSNIDVDNIDKLALEIGDKLAKVLTTIRELKNKIELKKSNVFKLYLKEDTVNFLRHAEKIITGATGSFTTHFVDSPVENSFADVSGSTSIYLVVDPLDKNLSVEKKKDEQKQKLLEDLEYEKGFLATVEKKLSNDRFVQNAKPEVLALEKKKKDDAESRIKSIEEKLANS